MEGHYFIFLHLHISFPHNENAFSCSVCIEGACQDRSRIYQPARTLQEQQQEAGSSQVLQLPSAEKAAGSGAGTG